MEIRGRLASGTRLLAITRSAADRLSLLTELLSIVADSRQRLIALVDAELEPVAAAVARVQEQKPPHLRIATVRELESGDWRSTVTAIERFVLDAESGIGSRTRVDAELETVLFLDLDAALTRCRSAGEIMECLRSVGALDGTDRRVMVETLSLRLIPQGMQADFFSMHHQWLYADSLIPHSDEGGALDRAALAAALALPRVRDQLLMVARGAAEEVAGLVPNPFRDYRRGILLLDAALTVLSCSPRAAILLGRKPAELVGEPVTVCLDGVDLQAFTRECAAPGDRSPFVISWRTAPGSYEPLEVSIDQLLSNNRSAGVILSLSRVERARPAAEAYENRRDSAAVTGGEYAEPPDDGVPGTPITPITQREHEVLLLLLGGYTNRDVGRELDIAEVTVKKHLTSLYRKLRVSSRAQLASSFRAPESRATE